MGESGRIRTSPSGRRRRRRDEWPRQAAGPGRPHRVGLGHQAGQGHHRAAAGRRGDLGGPPARAWRMPGIWWSPRRRYPTKDPEVMAAQERRGRGLGAPGAAGRDHHADAGHRRGGHPRQDHHDGDAGGRCRERSGRDPSFMVGGEIDCAQHQRPPRRARTSSSSRPTKRSGHSSTSRCAAWCSPTSRPITSITTRPSERLEAGVPGCRRAGSTGPVVACLDDPGAAGVWPPSSRSGRLRDRIPMPPGGWSIRCHRGTSVSLRSPPRRRRRTR